MFSDKTTLTFLENKRWTVKSFRFDQKVSFWKLPEKNKDRRQITLHSWNNFIHVDNKILQHGLFSSWTRRRSLSMRFWRKKYFLSQKGFNINATGFRSVSVFPSWSNALTKEAHSIWSEEAPALLKAPHFSTKPGRHSPHRESSI